MHESIRRGEPFSELDTVPPVRQEGDIVRRARFAIAANQDQVIRVSQPGERLQEHRQILLARKAARIREQPHLARQAQSFAQLGRPALGTKYFGVHTKRLVNCVIDTETVQVFAHQPARREHYIEALVQPADVAADSRLAETSHAAADELRQVRVIEGDDRNTAAARDDP